MSKTVDERVVEMKFDNKDFESNVKTSMNTLDKLKSDLKFDGASKGFEELNKSASKVDLNPISNGVDAVRMKFDALQVMAVTALANITNSAVNFGKQMVSAFAIQPIKDGFSEYELLMDSVRTIQASTGESIPTINKYLDELNTYADKTIYTFSDMTQNIGKFTNSGVKLESAVKAIQGISNEAAVSGANANEASRAMYNFAQALSAGYTKLIDWKSIENANMATMEFKQQLLDTAVAMKTVTKVGDEYQTITTNNKGKVSDLFTATKGFNDALQHQWLTSEVLIQTLENYSTDVKAMSDAEKETWRDKLIGIGYTEEQIKGLEKLSEKSFDAATKITKFTQLVDVVKEAIGSGWAQSFRIIFGDFEEAKELWTGIGTVITDYVDKVSKARNATLEAWKNLGGRDTAIQALKNVFDALASVINPIRDAFNDVFPPMATYQIANITKEIERFTSTLKLSAESSEGVKKAFTGIFTILKTLGNTIGLIARTVAPILYTVFSGLISLFVKFAGFIGELITKWNNFISSTRSGSGELSRLDRIVNNICTGLNNLFNSLTKVKVSFSGLITDSQKARAAAAISKILNNIGKALEQLSQQFANIKWLSNFQKGLDDATGTFNKFGNGVVEFIVSGLERLANLDFSFNDKVKETNTTFTNLTNTIDTGSNTIIKRIQEIGTAISNAFVPTDGIVKSASERFKEISGAMATGLDGQGVFDKVVAAVKTALFGVLVFEFTKGFNQLLEVQTKFVNKLSGLMGSIKGFFKALTTDIKVNTVRKTIKDIALAITMLVGSLYVLSTIDQADLDKAMGALEKLASGLLLFAGTIQFFSFDMFKANSDAIKSMGIALIAIAAALLILTPVIKQFEGVSRKDALTGVGAVFASVIALCGVLAVMAKNVSKFNGMNREMLAMGVTLIAVAEAVKILSSAILNIGYMDAESMARGTGAVVFLIGELTTALVLLVKETSRIEGVPGKMMAFGAAMIEIAAAMMILSVPIKILGQMRWQDLVKGVGAVSVGMVAMAASLKIASSDFGRFTSSAGKMVAAGAAMMAIATAMTILVIPIEILGHMDMPKLAQGLGSVIVGLGAMALALKFVSGSGAGNTLAAGAAIMMIAAALNLLIGPITILGTLPLQVVAQGLTAFLAAMAGFAVVGIIAQTCSAGLMALGTSLLMISGAVVVAGIGVAAIGIGLLNMAAGLTALSAISGLAAKNIVNAITIIVTGLLTMIPKIEVELINAAMSLIEVLCETIIKGAPLFADALNTVIVTTFATLASSIPAIMESGMVMFDAIMAALVKYTPTIVENVIVWIIQIIDGVTAKMPDLLGSIGNLISTIVKTIIDGINNLSSSSLNELAEFGDRLLSFFTRLASLSLLGAPAMLGVIIFGELIAELTVVLTAVGAINKIPGLQNFVESGGNLLAAIGTAIGQFLGGFVGGTLAGISTSLPMIGSNLSAFMTNATPFIEGAKDLGPEMLDGVNALVDTILALTGASVLNGLSLFAGGAIGFVAFGAELQAFGPMVSSFAEQIKNIDAAKVEAAASVGRMIVELSNSMPKSGGLEEAIFGKSDMEKFGDQLVSFGESIASFSEKVDGKIKESAVEAAKNAGTIMADLANSLPNSGGLAGLFAGENDIDTFGTKLVSFGESLASFSEKVDGTIKESAVEAAKNAGQIMLDLASSLPNSGGVISVFTGDNSMDAFGKQLLYFGYYMAAYSEKISGIDVSAVESTAAAGKCMAELASTIPRTGGGISLIFGDASMETFGNQLSQFGEAFSAFSKSVAGIVYEDVYNAVACVRQLVHLGEDMSKFDTSVYSQFASGLKLMASNAIQSFCDAFNTCGDRVSRAVNVLFTTVNNTININGTTLHDAGVRVGNDIDSGMTQGINAGLGLITAAVNTVCNTILSSFRTYLPAIQFNTIAQNNIMVALQNGMKSRQQLVLYTIKSICNEMIREFDRGLPKSKFEDFGRRIIQGLIDGLKDSSKKSALTSTITTICNDIVNAFTREFKSNQGKFAEIGKMVDEGLAKGIKDNSSVVSDAAAKVAKDSYEKAKKSLEVNSPSKLFMRLGKFVDEGFAIGILNNADEVAESTSKMGNTAIESMRAAIASISDLIDSEMDTQPTITPVVDLSNIQNGAKKINSIFSSGLDTSVTYSNALAASPSSNVENSSAGHMTTSTVSNFNFTQNNYSPKALSAKEIYRQTKNQFSALKGAVSGT